MYIIEGVFMDLQIAKWGNSLALRIPAEYVRRMGLSAGEHVYANMSPDGTLMIRHEPFDRKKFSLELRQLRQAMPQSQSVIDKLRRDEARY
ncbi:MAG: AbrB/MazE/SpoVT family DNA-binding domain-containing protein [Gammaproteobacteria bacterium]|nr:AbrB/MazE/SpoVT family DNA-binding domain-containing protein [Gammaproteobacteria bacterium]